MKFVKESFPCHSGAVCQRFSESSDAGLLQRKKTGYCNRKWICFQMLADVRSAVTAFQKLVIMVAAARNMPGMFAAAIAFCFGVLFKA